MSNYKDCAEVESELCDQGDCKCKQCDNACLMCPKYGCPEHNSQIKIEGEIK